MKFEDRNFLILSAMIGGVVFVAAISFDKFNAFISHPMVSGLLITLFASIVIPKRIEVESSNTLKKGFYSDIIYILERYKLLSYSIAKCAQNRSFEHSRAIGPIEHGNESLSLSRLNQKLSLTSNQKDALIKSENAVNIVNLNLAENISKLQASLAEGFSGVHSDNNIKAAYNGVCLIIYILSKVVELEERLVLKDFSPEVYVPPVLNLLYPDDAKMRERLLKWQLSEFQLTEIILTES
ncbi:hypothetical protein ACEUDH_10265 [Aeromonas dhakensis]|uniref:hypothetical protein n=1 Tax=Aeromonas TaxID=642 RepID=UPI001C22E79B|nr:hypothetical protein [Aeromonas sp. FDAARGOS 1403]QXA13768.1 hypothetical protein I6L33_11805 [Aeromonas sp. FDAARGOS 1403]